MFQSHRRRNGIGTTATLGKPRAANKILPLATTRTLTASKSWPSRVMVVASHVLCPLVSMMFLVVLVVCSSNVFHLLCSLPLTLSLSLQTQPSFAPALWVPALNPCGALSARVSLINGSCFALQRHRGLGIHLKTNCHWFLAAKFLPWLGLGAPTSKPCRRASTTCPTADG